MKEWVRAHPYWALTLGYLLFFVFATAVWFAIGPYDLEEALTISFVWTLGYCVLAVFETRRQRKTKARLDEHGQIKAYIRYPDSPAGSLSSIWNQGIATPSAGSIHFQPAVYDTLEPSGRATTIKVQDLLPERRKLKGKEGRYIQVLGIEAMTLLTDEGKVEVAACPESLDKLSEVLGVR